MPAFQLHAETARWPVCWNTIDMQTHAQVPITEPQVLIRMDCVSRVAIYKSCQGRAKLGKNRAPSATELQFPGKERTARQTISCNVILLLLHCTRDTACIPKVVCSPCDSKHKLLHNFQHSTVTTFMSAVTNVFDFQSKMLKGAEMSQHLELHVYAYSYCSK
jgi:hypothetical protein